MNEEEKVLQFFKDAFVVDEVEFLSQEKARELLQRSEINVVRLKANDKRGVFYVARVTPKEND